MVMAALPHIRPALPDDSTTIAAVVRAASSPFMRETTVLGGLGLDRFLRDQMTAESANRFLVAEVEGHVVGMSAWRYEGEYLFLNHLFVHPSAQGRRVGTLLWARGMAVMARAGIHRLSVDVYEDNVRAEAWYRSLALEPVATRLLMAVPLTEVRDERSEWTSTYLGEADEAYGRYGFSQFTLTTQRAAYTIGRLGQSYFRCTAALMEDAVALAALHRLDPHRRVLCIDGSEWWQKASERGATPLGRTIRLRAPLEQVVARLDEVLSASGCKLVE